MGRIKPTLIKRTSRKFLESNAEIFTKDFDHNKKVIGDTLPSKRVRNKIAGYVARLRKNTKTLINDEQNGSKESEK